MEKYYTPEEAAALLPGMTKSLLAQLRYRGSGPRFVRVSPRKIAYAESALSAYLASHEAGSTQESATA